MTLEIVNVVLACPLLPAEVSVSTVYDPPEVMSVNPVDVLIPQLNVVMAGCATIRQCSVILPP